MKSWLESPAQGSARSRTAVQRIRVIAFSACALLLCLAQVGAQESPRPLDRWEARLEALDPSRPLDYLILGEEIADAANSEDERGIARELFAFAGALDSGRLGRSAMLAIASVTTGAERTRALVAAEIVGGRGWSRSADRMDAATIEALARSFSQFRRGNGAGAAGALRQSEADAALERFDRSIPGGAQGYRDECRRLGRNGQPADWEMARKLMDVELALRHGAARGISLGLALEGDEPLVELDTSNPLELWGVNPMRAWRRDRRWSGN